MKRKILARIVVPAGLEFSALRLRRHPNGDISYERAVVRRILEASGISEAVERAADPEDLHSGVIIGWYRMHREAGGAPDPVVEELIAEDAEERRHEAN